jgi:AcrR family transcriptional regulator
MPPRKHLNLQRVVETAIELANEHGFEAVTLASVAEQLGIRIPSLYNHVDGLPGLRYQMRLYGLRQLIEHARRAAVGKSGDEAVVSIANAYRAFAHAYPGIYAATLRAPDPDEHDLMTAAQEVIDILFAVLRPYDFDEEEMLHAIRAMRSVIHGFVDLETSGGFKMALDLDESFRRLVQGFIDGLHVRQQQLRSVANPAEVNA